MRVVTRDFLNDNNYRKYPIDVQANYEPYTEADVSLINSILLDVKLTLPLGVANAAYVANVSVSNALVTMTIMGLRTNPLFDSNHPAPTANLVSEQYTEFGAVVLGLVTALRSEALAQTPIAITPQIAGVGGWVVFGQGVAVIANWSFSHPESALLAAETITNYDYSGVKTISKPTSSTKLHGAVTLTGKGGLEVARVGNTNVLDLKFKGIVAQVKTELARHRGLCGNRPETGTCNYQPIRTINSLSPVKNPGGLNEIVIVINKPIYAGHPSAYEYDPVNSSYQTGGPLFINEFALGSCVTTESQCQNRNDIPTPPEVDCSPTPSPLVKSSTVNNDLKIPENLELILEVVGAAGYTYLRLNYFRQHITRPSIAVFKVIGTSKYLLGESLDEVHLDLVANVWQAYSGQGPSLNIFGSIFFNYSGTKQLELNGENYTITLGSLNTLDDLNHTAVKVGSDEAVLPDWVGTYLRKSYGLYIHSTNSNYVLKVPAGFGTVGLYVAGEFIAGGPINDKGFLTYIQNYKTSQNKPQFRVITFQGFNP